MTLDFDFWCSRCRSESFQINYVVVGRPKTEVQQDIAKPDENSFVLRDLAKFTNFTIEVVPFNKAGDGPASAVNAQTLPDRPGPVGPLVFNDILVDSVNVSWTPPSEPNGVILGYLVTYKTYKLEEGKRTEGGLRGGV